MPGNIVESQEAHHKKISQKTVTDSLVPYISQTGRSNMSYSKVIYREMSCYEGELIKQPLGWNNDRIITPTRINWAKKKTLD